MIRRTGQQEEYFLRVRLEAVMELGQREEQILLHAPEFRSQQEK
jgi:hypothetical protein